VTRSAAIAVRSAVTVAPVTRTVRGIASEVPLDATHGLRTTSVANCDSLQTIPKSALGRRLGTLAPEPAHAAVARERVRAVLEAIRRS